MLPPATMVESKITQNYKIMILLGVHIHTGQAENYTVCPKTSFATAFAVCSNLTPILF